MDEPLTEEELMQMQIDNPAAASSYTKAVLALAKINVERIRVSKKVAGRYGDSSNAPYYSLANAEKTFVVLNALDKDRNNDLMIPSRALSKSQQSARQFYSQAFNYIMDYPDEFEARHVYIVKHLRLQSRKDGLFFLWTVAEEDIESVFVRIPIGESDKEAEKEVTAPIKASKNALIENWKLKLEAWVEECVVGDKLTLAPLLLDSEEIQDTQAFIEAFGCFHCVVREEKITIKKYCEITV